jgi:hypothetical protein
MELFQAILLIGLGFCLGRMINLVNKEYKEWLLTLNQVVRIHEKIIHLLIINTAIIFIFLLIELIKPYLQ